MDCGVLMAMLLGGTPVCDHYGVPLAAAALQFSMRFRALTPRIRIHPTEANGTDAPARRDRNSR